MSELAKLEKIELLRLARGTIEVLLRERRIVSNSTETPALNQAGGAFVSLHRDGHLRGCIGRIRSPDPLWKTVQEMAVAAASQDFRFHPLHVDELNGLEIEISVLSVPERIQPEVIEVGRHGLIMTQGLSSGLLLPQVAIQYGWDSETFLRHTCEKAGLDPEAWRSSRSRIEAFTAQVFSEKEMVDGSRDEGPSDA